MVDFAMNECLIACKGVQLVFSCVFPSLVPLPFSPKTITIISMLIPVSSKINRRRKLYHSLSGMWEVEGLTFLDLVQKPQFCLPNSNLPELHVKGFTYMALYFNKIKILSNKVDCCCWSYMDKGLCMV